MPTNPMTRGEFRRAATILWSIVALTFFGLVGMIVYLLVKPEPAEFLSTEMLTPTVYPTGSGVAQSRSSGLVRIRATVRRTVDPTCLVTTQYLIRDNLGNIWNLPGVRINEPDQVSVSMYIAPIPVTMPPGRSEFLVRDIYSCGIRTERIASQYMPFTIVGPG